MYFASRGWTRSTSLEHLLGDVAVRDVPLLRRAQLDEVVDLPEAPGEQDPLAEGQGKHVLRLPGEIAGDDVVCPPGAGHALLVRRQQAVTRDLGRRAVSVGGAEFLRGLGADPVPLDVPEGPEVHQDVEGVGQMLQRAQRLVVRAPSLEVLVDHPGLVFARQLLYPFLHLTERMRAVAVQDGRDQLVFRVLRIPHQRDVRRLLRKRAGELALARVSMA